MSALKHLASIQVHKQGPPKVRADHYDDDRLPLQQYIQAVIGIDVGVATRATDEQGSLLFQAITSACPKGNDKAIDNFVAVSLTVETVHTGGGLELMKAL